MILTSLNISLIILGIYAATQDGYALEKPRIMIQNAMDRIFGVVWSDILQKPLFSCVICMSSVWSLVLSPYFGIKIFDIPMVILTVAGINFIINSVFCLMKNFIHPDNR